jgi:hypothetical protein
MEHCMSLRFLRAIASATVLAVAACQDNSDPTTVNDPLAARGGIPGPDLPSAADFDRRVPGFGGYYLAADGSPTVYLTRGSSRAPAEAMLSGYLNGRGLGASSVRVIDGQYNWKQLQRWQEDATTEALDIAGAVYVDNDETTNRVVIGVSDMAAAGQVRAAAARAGIPAAAVDVRQVEPIVPLATLQNVVDRPVRAGVQINFPGFLCSVGFNATAGSQRSLITASHCTTKQGGVENTPYYQPLQSVNGTVIATEVADPAYLKNGPGCPKGKMCRYSDASRAVYSSSTASALGAIARTSGPNNNSLDIVGSFTITADDCGTTGGCLPVGATLNKVGRTTGWTAGPITNTCVNTGVQGTRFVQLCQTFVTAGVAGGDSGSDVFQVTSGTSVKLAGILWGGGGSSFVFSPFGNVVRELGALTTH